MSRFSGKQHKGAMRMIRDEKRTEAEARNARTPLQRTRLYRLRIDVLSSPVPTSPGADTALAHPVPG